MGRTYLSFLDFKEGFFFFFGGGGWGGGEGGQSLRFKV